MSRKTIISLLIAAYLAVGCATGYKFADFRSHLALLSSPSTIDCGHVKLGESFTSQQSCAKSAFESNQSFFVSHDLQGIDSYISEGFVRQPNGHMLLVFFDSDPRGGAKKDKGVINTSECIAPVFSGIDWSENTSMFKCE